MSKYRIKAYFMHEHERDAAQKAVDAAVIDSAEWTPGFVMGVVDKSQIPKLAEKGLVITSFEEVRPTVRPPKPNARARNLVATLGVKDLPGVDVLALNQPLTTRFDPRGGRPLPVVASKRASSDKVLSRDTRRPNYYIVRFHGPLTRERFLLLKRCRTKPIERLSRNKYTIRLAPAQVKALSELPFVDMIRLYSASDTMRQRDEPRPPPAERVGAKRPAHTSSYFVRLHRKKDMRSIVSWLARRKRVPLWRRRDALRVALLQDGRDVRDLAERPEVATVEAISPPRLFDEHARDTLRIPAVSKGPSGLTGEGEVIGIADTGLDDTHPDFAGRIVGVSAWGRPNDTSDPEGHGTHVAGCALGDGTASGGEVVGAAPKACVFLQSILDAKGTLGGLPDDLNDLLKEAHVRGARIHNNSWGAFNFAGYSITSLQVDEFVAAHPDMLVVIAAGNDGMGVPRDAGALMNANRGYVDWPCVAAPATAKNGLTVGASRSPRRVYGYSQLTWRDAWEDRFPHDPIAKQRISGNGECLAAFSSRGPCDDQRFKPDLVAPGTDIAAARSRDAPLRKFWGAYPKNDRYGFMGGTSMAAPYVAGCAALVREYYRKRTACKTPSAALLKATLVNGARRITGQDAQAPKIGDPNYHQGFGRVDMAQTLPNETIPKLRLAFDDTWKEPSRILVRTGTRVRYRVRVESSLPLRISLAWTDPAARSLQNSLILLVDDGGTRKWIGNERAATLLNIAGAMRDPHDNVQVVRIDQPVAGTYTIAVMASSLLKPPQSFALVVSGDLGSALHPMLPDPEATPLRG